MSDGRPNVFAVSRSVWDDPDFPEQEFSEREAWIWLISSAAWKEIRTRGNAGSVTLKRGEFSFSVRFLATKWGWKKDRVHRFMTKLKKRDMVNDSERDGNQVYFITNYNKFQVVGAPKCDSERDTDRDASATAPRQHRDKEETGETGETVKEDSSLRSEERASETKAQPDELVIPDFLDRRPKPQGSEPQPKPTAKRAARKPEPQGFAEFYDTFPRHVARPAAVKAYARALSRASPEVLLAGALRYATERENEDQQFTKHPATWLNNDGWLDEEPKHGNGNRHNGSERPLRGHQAFLAGGLLAMAGEGGGPTDDDRPADPPRLAAPAR